MQTPHMYIGTKKDILAGPGAHICSAPRAKTSMHGGLAVAVIRQHPYSVYWYMGLLPSGLTPAPLSSG